MLRSMSDEDVSKAPTSQPESQEDNSVFVNQVFGLFKDYPDNKIDEKGRQIKARSKIEVTQVQGQPKTVYAQCKS